MADLTVGVTFPGEALIVAALEFAKALVEGQPPDVKAQMWRWVVEDLRYWRKLLRLPEAPEIPKPNEPDAPKS